MGLPSPTNEDGPGEVRSDIVLARARSSRGLLSRRGDTNRALWGLFDGVCVGEDKGEGGGRVLEDFVGVSNMGLLSRLRVKIPSFCSSSSSAGDPWWLLFPALIPPMLAFFSSRSTRGLS